MNKISLTFSVIICTYQRSESLAILLKSIFKQEQLPSEIIIVDGSEDDNTRNFLINYDYPGIIYKRADNKNRGLTRQRNLGIRLTNSESSILVFLDDDLNLEPFFFTELLKPFSDINVIGVDGLIKNECYWELGFSSSYFAINLDGYTLKLSLRDCLRAIFGLYPFDYQPGQIPPYGHGKSSLPPSGKTYEVQHIMGGMTAYRKSLFSFIQFSEFFIGYGLYEDFDFSVRASAFGKLIKNTAACCTHHHAISGRPNYYHYGRMVVKNGWYIWRLKHPRPSFINKLKWYLTTLLLILIRFSNFMLGSSPKQALGDALGRTVALFILFFKKPQIHS